VVAPPEPDHVALALAAERAGQHLAAAQHFRDAIAKQPEAIDLHQGLLRTLIGGGAHNDAIDAGERALRRFTKDAELHAQLAKALNLKAETLRNAGGPSGTPRFELEDAAMHGSLALGLDADHLEARLILAQTLFQLGRNDEAELHAKEAIRRHPNHPGGHLVAGDVALDRYLTARAQTDAMAKDDPALAPAATTREAHFATAIARFRSAARVDPERYLSWRRLGDLFAWQNNDAEVLANYAKALVRDPLRGAPHDWVTEHFPAKQCIELYANALRERDQQHPRDTAGATLAWYLGFHSYRAGQWAECLASFTAALTRNPEFKNSLYYLGRAAYFEEDATRAEQYFERYAEEAPVSFADLLRTIGKEGEITQEILVYLAAKSNRERNLGRSRALNHVLALVRDTADDWNNYAFLCRETGRFEESFAGYTRALEHAPEDPALINDCALILQYHLHRDLDQAAKMYDRALKAAQKILRDPQASSDDRSRARQAISDASGNLKKLRG
jgi:tetratricopeptide (TPR) repeat protein